jgi:hypothetical protein
MATIWTFGDSLTERFNSKEQWAKDYIEWKGYVPKVYGNFISENLNYELQNKGIAGSDNYTILQTFCNSYELIQPNDIILIGWTSCYRFRLVTKYNKWSPLHPNFDNYLKNFNNLSKNTIDEILINRDNIQYVDEVNSWIRFINKACVNNKVIHWNHYHNNLDTFYFVNFERIRDETNGIVNDSHFSETGQKHLSNELLNIITTDTKIVKTKSLI